MLSWSSSLSSPSEPPDVGNWFSSYKYESFVLDTYDDALKGCAFKECNGNEDGENEGFGPNTRNSEEEGNLGEFGKINGGSSEHKLEDLSKMPDSAHSLPVLSEEPPHARNWFSSYVYESPLLDTLGDLKGSVAGESEYKKEGFASEESELVKEGNLEESRNSWSSNELVDFGDGNMCTNVFANPIENPSLNKPLSEIPDSSNSFSNLSEPPDIKNWFFSYAYESPESNVFADKESESEEDDSANQQDNKAKCKSGQTGTSDEIAFDETLKSNGSLKFNRSLRDEEENNSMDEGNKAPPARISTPKSITWNLKSTSPTEDVLPPVSEESVRKSHCGSNGKENQGIEVAGNGFVTTKKNRGRENDENSMPKPHKILSECSTKNTKKASDGKDAMKRKVLSERTNFEAECNDVTGKWKCPQKSKPNTGPPLKQLRLERWVHRL